MTPSHTQQPWIERTWSFEFPVELYPSLLERLRGTPARLEEQLSGLPPAQLVDSSRGGWSLQRHAGHLWDLEGLFEARLAEFLSGAETLTPADMSNQATDAADHDSAPVAELLARFRQRRMDYVGRLDALQPADFARSALHPRLNTPMRLADLCLFHADHDDHHLAIIQAHKRA